MLKRVYLLAVSCKKGGLCPGGIDLDDPRKWIRIVRDDQEAGSVQGFEIDFAKPLDIIEFDGYPVPNGLQQENWAIANNSCRKIGTDDSVGRLIQAYNEYSYRGFWGNIRAYITESEAQIVSSQGWPSESILAVSNIDIYKNENGKSKIDFDWHNRRLTGISLTDQDFYGHDRMSIPNALIVVSIPAAADWKADPKYEGRAYKFVSKVFSNITVNSQYTNSF